MARAKYAEWLTEQGLERLAEMAPRLTDAEMAKEMGISSSTFYEWLKKHPEMSEAVTRARTGADARASACGEGENRLRRRGDLHPAQREGANILAHQPRA